MNPAARQIDMTSSNNTYEGDALNRAAFGTNLSKLISHLDSGVIGIDGAWGAGKTWFGQRIRIGLRESPQIRTIWIDTFAADWHDDPVLSLLAEFSEQLPKDQREEFLTSAAPLAAKLLIAAGKAGLKAAGNVVGFNGETVDEVIDAAQSASDAYIKKRLQELAERKKSIEQLKKLLSGAVPQDGKIVVFVDELDRCSPAYAIRFLERIKHLFEIPGVVFVLLWNRTQIHQAVKTFYGQDTDGQMYLDRFVDYPIRLPNHHLDRRDAGLGLIVEAEIQKLQGNEQVLLHEVANLIGGFGDVLRLTSREIKHVCAWWVMTNGRRYEIIEAWLLCIKVKRPDIYERLAIDEAGAHKAASNLLIAPPSNSILDNIYVALQKFHRACDTKVFDTAAEFSSTLFRGAQPDLLSVTKDTILRIEAIKP